ncbi:hypothetical protein [Desulfonema magnum]|uniref:Uncharacterized protein n=1 Tax=Desulfonema magnum TaxID=45655 RepID=A0A975BQJ3_9BACT|nr:hypothetical protein [Desulfonema magnum]QTA89851.1 Uncharacterized protein dnm_059080 [Desulfonema magnum]
MDKKKMTAAMSAVMSYIQTEEEAAVCMAGRGVMPVAEEKPCVPEAPLKLWGISGRQAIMQMRNLMQMRALR